MVLLKDLPKWIQAGEQVKVFQEQESIDLPDDLPNDQVDDQTEISDYYNKEDDSISNLEEFKQVFSICRYFGIPFPPSVFNYTIKDEYGVLFYFYPIRDQIEIKSLIDMIRDEPIIKMSYEHISFSDSSLVGISFLMICLNIYHSNIKFSLSINEREKILKSISSYLRNKTQMSYESKNGYIDGNGRPQYSSLISFKEDNIYGCSLSFKIGRNRYMLADFFDELAVKDLTIN